LADSSIAITAGAGTQVDTRTQAGGDHRQVVVIGDPDATDTASVGAAGTNAGLSVRAGKTSTGPTPARVSDATTSTQLLAANTNRLGVVIHNDSTAALFVKYGTAASSTSYVYKLAAGATLSLPEPGQPLYTGVIHGIWDADTASGAATVNELT
jgi:hypothetical protein